MAYKKHIGAEFDSFSILNELPDIIIVLDKNQVVFQNKAATQHIGKIKNVKTFLNYFCKDESSRLSQFISDKITTTKKAISPFIARFKVKKGLITYEIDLKTIHTYKMVILKDHSIAFPDVEEGVYFEYTLGKESTLDCVLGHPLKLLGASTKRIKVAGGFDQLFNKSNGKSFTGFLKALNKKSDTIKLPFPIKNKQLDHAILLRYEREVCKPTGLIKLRAHLIESSIHESVKKLREEAHQKLDLILNNSNEVITFYTFYPKEKYVFVSPNIEKILGFKAEQLLTDNHFFEKRLKSDLKQYRMEVSWLKKNQRLQRDENRQFDYKIINNKGQDVWIENSLVPIKSKSGKIDFYMNILRDVTAKKEAALAAEVQNTNYRNLLDNSPVAYLIHDRGVCIYVNNAFLKLFKFKNKEQVNGKFLLDFMPVHERKTALERLERLYNQKQRGGHTLNLSIPDSGQNLLDVEISSVLIQFNNRDCVLSLITNIGEQREREEERLRNLATEVSNKKLKHEIRERQEVEKILKDKTAHLSAILESSTHLVWTVDVEFRITSFNKNFADVVKHQRDVVVRNGMRVDEHLDQAGPGYAAYWYPLYERGFKGEKLEFEKEDVINGKIVYRRVFINPIHTPGGAVTELSCIANDITESKHNEQRLVMQTSKLSAIFDSSHHYIWSVDREGHLTSFNRNYFDLVSSLYNTIPYVGFKLDRGVLSQNKEYNDELKNQYALAFSGRATNFEVQTKDRSNQLIYLDIFLNPIYEKSEVVEVSGIAHNITDKKLVQQKMEVSLKEKEILLREVHHRVKNNMQVISSILNLQSSYVSDEYALMLLQESQNRIKTMAYIHESLYQNKSFTSVNFTEYARTLVRNIVQSYSYSSDKIKLEVQTEQVVLSLDNSIPVGLILNELVTNAIKHAFPGNRKGTVFFKLYSTESFVYLEVKDDGVGFAPGVDVLNSHTLGFQLVQTLTEQVEGELTHESKPGETIISVRFKK